MQIYNSAVAEAQLLHSRNEDCAQRASDALFFSIFKKAAGPGRPIQRSFRMGNLETVVAATKGAPDTYISQSSFFAPDRQVIHFKQVRAAWVDLDLYNIDKKVDPQAISEILKHAESLGIPAPSAIISSGRGVNLKWFFEVAVTQSQLLVWQALQATLTAAFACFAADFKARDAARVFRLLDTKNSKSGETVSLLEGGGKLYDFAALCSAVESLRCDLLIDGADKVEKRIAKLVGASGRGLILPGTFERGNPEALQLYSELNEPIMLDKRSERSLNFARFCDLRDLFTMRGGIAVGERNNAMFIMVNSLAQAGVIRSENFEQEVKQLLQSFPHRESFDPLTDGSMSSLFRRIKDKEQKQKYTWRGRAVDPLFRPSNKHLIDTFSILPTEMSKLKTIISAEEKLIRADAKHQGRAEKRIERNAWKAEIKLVFDAAKENAINATINIADNAIDTLAADDFLIKINISALAARLGLDRTTVYRHLRYLNKPQPVVNSSTANPSQAASAAIQTAQNSSRVATPGRHIDPSLTLSPPAVAIIVSTPLTAKNPTTTDLQRAIQLFEAHKLAKQASKEAAKTKEAVEQLSIQARLQKLRDNWASRKMLEVIQPFSQAEQQINPNSNKEPNMATANLLKKMALLDVAKGNPTRPPETPLLTASSPAFSPSNASADLVHIPPISDDLPVMKVGDVVMMVPPSQLLASTTNVVAYSSPAARLRAFSAKPKAFVARAVPAGPAPAAQNKSADVPGEPSGASKARPEPHAQQSQQATPQITRQANGAAALLTPTQRLRAVAERGAKLPPLQLESRGPKSKKQLVEGGALAPEGYPDESEWPSNITPPGSHYSEADWAAARTNANGVACEVMEFQVPDKSWLMQIPKPVERVLTVPVKGVNTKIIDRDYPDGLNAMGDMMQQFFPDCIWVAEAAFPTFPGATEAKCMRGEVAFHVIRSRVDYTEPARFYRVGTKMNMSLAASDVANEQDSIDSQETNSATNIAPIG
jgi:hypothetical protein